jgi:ferredoxin
VTYIINEEKCLKCGLCVTECPEGAIVVDERVSEPDGLILYMCRIDQERCTECGTCQSHEWWCPAKAIEKV